MSALAVTAMSHEGDVAVARIRGEIDISNSADLTDAVLRGMANDSRGLVVDLSAVAYLDSAGVHLIFKLARALARRQQTLSVVAVPGSPIEDVLRMTDVPKVIGVHGSVETAVAVR